MKKVLIIGYGSIGKKHARILSDLGAQIDIITSQSDIGFKTFSNVENALQTVSYDLVIVANETKKHLATINKLQSLKFKNEVYVEKPIFEKCTELKHTFKGLFVLYNLRHSPLLEELKKRLEKQKVISANIYCGQYLPLWRSGRDYRNTYSAHKDEGGGVIRDLSHELDYSCWLFGDMVEISALGGHYSPLEITSDDVFNILGLTKDSSLVNISINYLDKNPRRTIIVNTDTNTYFVDFIKGELFENDKLLLSNIKTSDTYVIQAQKILFGKTGNFCSLNEANMVMKLIEASEASSDEKRFKKL